jgi:DNA-binding helix-hairpin-helix protein with protein kinase domain
MTKVLLTQFMDTSGTTVRLGKKIGSGGEGDVYEILPAHQKIVAKIYHKPLEARKQEKLLLMARGCNEELKAISAWPTDVLRTKPEGPIVGFLMPRISGCEPIHKAYGPTHRKEVFPHADWRFLVRTAKNLAAAFFVIHKFGYVIGDVNEGNILVDDKACVRLIDCDSFQVRASDQLYYCEVGVAQFTPPEIQKLKNFRMERSANHDNFGLSILIFQLLFFGRHPYSGVYTGKEDMPIEKAIAEFRFAYSKNSHTKAIAPPPNSVGLSVVPNTVADLFENAFLEPGTRPEGRPGAGEWWETLETLEKRMRQCTSDSAHIYYSGLSSCPWCKLEEVSGVLLFLSRDSITKIDLRREWQKVEATKIPGPSRNIGPGNFPARPAPLPAGVGQSLAFTSFRQIAGLVIIAACALLAIGGIIAEADYLVFLPVAVIVLLLFFFPGRATVEKRRRKKNLESARYLWDLWNRKWMSEAGDAAFWAQMNHLRELRRKYESIDREYRAGLLTLEGSVKERQLQQFLACYTIDTCPVPRVTEGLKAILKSSGIETAADVTPRKLLSIPQLDNTLTNEILSWREKRERNFLFDPTKGIERSDIRALIHKYQPMMKPVERELKAGIAKLHRIGDDIEKKQIALRPAVEKKAKELAQAEADFEVFGRTMEESIKRDIDLLIRPRGSTR